jgi:anti-anti-sigma factor
VDFRPFALAYQEQSDTLVVTGSIDETVGPELRQAIERHSAGYTRDLTIDLGDVDFLPSLGVGVLALAMRSADQNDATISLVAVEGTVAQRVLSICALPHTLR